MDYLVNTIKFDNYILPLNQQILMETILFLEHRITFEVYYYMFQKQNDAMEVYCNIGTMHSASMS